MNNSRVAFLKNLARFGVAAATLAGVGCWLPGERCVCNRKPDFPCGAVPSPPGTYLHMHETLQASRAAQSRYCIYQHEWYDGGPSLGPEGREHLGELIPLLRTNECIVLLEPQMVRIEDGQSVDDAVREQFNLNERRRSMIIAALVDAGVPNAPSRVLVGDPATMDLYGIEAPIIYNRLFNLQQGPGGGQGRGGGGFGGGGGGFGGGFGGGGGGFGGGGLGFF